MEGISIQETEDSNYITIKGQKHSLYIDVFKSGEIIINAYKDKRIVMNWEGDLENLITKLNELKSE